MDSTPYGEHNDDMDMVAATRPFFEVDEQMHQAKEGPVEKYIGDLFPIKEYVLTDRIGAELGLIYSHDSEYGTSRTMAPEQFPDIVRYFIYSHDECFTYIRPSTHDVLTSLINRILQLHAFLLNLAEVNIDWRNTTAQLIQLLERYSSITLKSRSSSKGHGPTIDIQLPLRAWARNIWPGLEFRSAGRIEFEGSIANVVAKLNN